LLNTPARGHGFIASRARERETLLACFDEAGDTASLLRTTDGASWTSPSPVSETVGRGLTGLACPGALQCFGVGTFNTTGDPGDRLKSLVMRET
jgi:hypothetical protein